MLGPRVRQDGAAAIDLWSALAGIEWHGPEGAIVCYSLRDAGDLVAWVREDGDYLDWYCSGPTSIVASWINFSLGCEGWSWWR